MTDHASYTYDDSDRKLTIREMGGRVDIFVRDLDDSAMVLLPAEQRQAAAQALAGDGYVVHRRNQSYIPEGADSDPEPEPLDSETVDQGRTVNVAWVHQQHEGVPIHYLATDTWITARTDEEGLLFTLQWPERYSTRISLARMILGASFDLAAQPDRPEPVDPSEVRVGDVVEVEGDDWMERTPVTDVDDPNHDGPRYPQDSPFGVMVNKLMWWPDLADATVRILRRAEPEPDPAAVEALAKILDSADLFVATAGERVETARRLIRDHGVHVEVPDA